MSSRRRTGRTVRSRLAAALCLACAGGLVASSTPTLAAPASTHMAAQSGVRPSTQAAQAAQSGPRGSAGVGDPYFPLDGNGGIDVEHYKIRQSWNFKTSTLRGRTTLTLRTTAPLRRFNLDFLLPVSSVRVASKRARFTRPNRHELTIRPSAPLAAGQRVKVRVTYAGKPGRIRHRGEPGFDITRGREVLAVNQPHVAAWWFPGNDHPSDRATFDVTTTVPKGRQVVGNGRLVSRRTKNGRTSWRWRAAEPMVSYLAYFAAGKFRITKSRDRAGRPTWYAVSRDLSGADQRSALKALRRTPAITAWLEKRLARPYPFATNGGVVVSQMGFALENQTRPVYSWWPGSMTTTTVHELAHQWFGDDVSLNRWSDIWLNEGAASYMEWLWAEDRKQTPAADQLDMWLQVPRSQPFWKVRIGRPGAANIFDMAVYLRGAMTFQALRNRVGDEVFFSILTTWLTERSGGPATSAQFEALAARLSGQDLSGFFDAWLRTAAKPARTAANGTARR